MKVWMLCFLAACTSLCAAADDARQLVSLPATAEANLRTEMRASLLALNEILTLIGAGRTQEAAAIAEKELGLSAMGKYRNQPFEARPGPHMPPAMHAIGVDGHHAASEFARVAATGDSARTITALPTLTAACVACHFSYRLR